MTVEPMWPGSYPPGVPRAVDFESTTMPEILTRTAGRFPLVTALVFMGKKISYRELEAAVNRCAGALAAIGVKAGERVGLLLPNMPQLVIANYAAQRIGAVPAMMNPLSDEEDLISQCTESDVKVLITLDLLFPRALDVKEKTGIRSVIACHVTDYLPFPGNKLLPYVQKALYRKIEPQPGVHEFLTLLQTCPDTPVENRARWEETGAVLFSDGTAGAGKGVMLTHANISCNAQQLRAWLRDLPDGNERLLAAVSFFHSAGWTGIQNLSILAGWTDILVPRPESQVIIEIMRKCRPTLLWAMPETYRGLLAREAFRKMDLSSLRGFFAVGSPLPKEAIRELKTLNRGPVINLYGLTEISAMGTATPWGGPEKQGTAGLPLPGTDLKIVDQETGSRALPTGEAGEICVRGPQLMQGYCKKTGETPAVLTDGWLFTGDIGFFDEEGHLTVLGRKADLITADGQAIHPAEIDAVIVAHPQVFEACTIGVPDERHGETVKSYVVLRPRQVVKAGEIIAHCRESLAPEKVPQSVEFVDALPRSAAGKILRREVRELDRKKRAGKK